MLNRWYFFIGCRQAIFLGFVLLICSPACDHIVQVATLSDTERKGAEDVSSIFGSTVTCKRTLSTSTLEGEANYFQIQIDSLSSLMARFKTHPTMLSSNAALLFYKNLTPEEKHRLAHVRIVLPLTADSIVTYTLSLDLLNTLLGKMPLIEQVIEGFKKKDYQGILASLDTPEAPAHQKEFLTLAKKGEELFGDVTDYLPLGFKVYERNDGLTWVRFFAILKASKKNAQFSLDFDLDPTVKTISGVRFAHNL